MYTYKCTVTKIIDGDTIDVDIHLGFDVVLTKQRIRLMGIDTPESRTRNLEEKARGLLSKQYMIDKCPVGSKITLKSLDRGKFGRILGEIWEADVDSTTVEPLNKRMITDGFAVEYYGGSKDELEAKHMKNKEILIAKGLL
jgi:micrococcal nuclease|tara:strand:- start:909 stop:1331 length:423 start_codon:yes stop_codon:yes gene_type:complete